MHLTSPNVTPLISSMMQFRVWQTDGNLLHDSATGSIQTWQAKSTTAYSSWQTSYYHTSYRLFTCGWRNKTGQARGYFQQVVDKVSVKTHILWRVSFSIIIQAKIMGSSAITHWENWWLFTVVTSFPSYRWNMFRWYIKIVCFFSDGGSDLTPNLLCFVWLLVSPTVIKGLSCHKTEVCRNDSVTLEISLP